MKKVSTFCLYCPQKHCLSRILTQVKTEEKQNYAKHVKSITAFVQP